MIIEVKQNHIRVARELLKSHRGLNRARCCPVAIAISRKFPTANVRVIDDEFNINDKSYYPSESVKRFIRKFDANLPVKPFLFRLPREA